MIDLRTLNQHLFDRLEVDGNGPRKGKTIRNCRYCTRAAAARRKEMVV